MPTEINANGYSDLRGYVKDNWDHIALIDDTDTEVLRIDIASDARGQFTSDETSNPLTAQLTITGQDLVDEGESLPVTLSSTEAYKSQAAGAPMGSDTHANATLETVLDEFILNHDYSIPQ